MPIEMPASMHPHVRSQHAAIVEVHEQVFADRINRGDGRAFGIDADCARAEQRRASVESRDDFSAECSIQHSCGPKYRIALRHRYASLVVVRLAISARWTVKSCCTA